MLSSAFRRGLVGTDGTRDEADLDVCRSSSQLSRATDLVLGAELPISRFERCRPLVSDHAQLCKLSVRSECLVLRASRCLGGNELDPDRSGLRERRVSAGAAREARQLSDAAASLAVVSSSPSVMYRDTYRALLFPVPLCPLATQRPPLPLPPSLSRSLASSLTIFFHIHLARAPYRHYSMPIYTLSHVSDQSLPTYLTTKFHFPLARIRRRRSASGSSSRCPRFALARRENSDRRPRI